MGQSKVRRFFSTKFGIVILFFILFFSYGLIVSGLQDGQPTGPDEEFNESEIETLVLEYVNEKRTANGMNPLSENSRAADAARSHAEDMAEKDYFNHTSPDGETQEERYAFCDGGENAYQTWVNEQIDKPNGSFETLSTEQEVAKSVVNGWMHSDPHRERGIYGEWWVSAGAGVVITEDGKVYTVLGFCSR